MARRPEWAARDREGACSPRTASSGWTRATRKSSSSCPRSWPRSSRTTTWTACRATTGCRRCRSRAATRCRPRCLRTRARRRRPPSDFRDAAWVRWRAEKLSAIAERLYPGVKRRKPHALVSWSPSIFSFSLDDTCRTGPRGCAAATPISCTPRCIVATSRLMRRPSTRRPRRQLTPARRALMFPGMLIRIGSYVAPESLVRQWSRSTATRLPRRGVLLLRGPAPRQRAGSPGQLLKSHLRGPGRPHPSRSATDRGRAAPAPAREPAEARAARARRARSGRGAGAASPAPATLPYRWRRVDRPVWFRHALEIDEAWRGRTCGCPSTSPKACCT